MPGVDRSGGAWPALPALRQRAGASLRPRQRLAALALPRLPPQLQRADRQSTAARNIDNNTRNQTAFDGSRWVSLPVNTGRARARGLELEAKFPLKAVFATTTALDLRASLSRNWF